MVANPQNRVGNYELIEQLEAGPDGRAFRAVDAVTGKTVELWLLNETQPWEKRIRLAELVQSRFVRHVLAHQFGDPSFVALPWSDAPRLSQAAAKRKLPVAEAVRLIRDLAELLTECHRWGLTLGNLSPETLRLDESQSLLVDLLAADTGVNAAVPGFQPPSDALFEAERDVVALGRLLAWLLTGDAQATTTAVEEVVRGSGLAGTHLDDVATRLAQLGRDTAQAEPETRPTMSEFRDRIDGVYSTLTGKTAIGTTAVISHDNRLGRFRLLQRLGSGGMGEVHKAEDLSDGSVVAIKTLHPSRDADDQASRRFRREARMLAQIDSPFVARLLEINHDGDRDYLVMEYVDGVSLSDVIKASGPLPEATALHIAADVAMALAEAHDRGIVHRDVKPANVLLVDFAERGGANGVSSPVDAGRDSALAFPRIKLVDFGLARRRSRDESIAVTRTNSAVGTPAYMPPEQALGNTEPDPRADVYALGVTLYEMLAGRLPFTAEDILTLAFQHSYEQAPPLQTVNPQVSDGAARIVAKCLAKNPEGRYANARELLADVQRHLRGEPTNVQAHPVLPAHDPRRIFSVEWQWDLESSPAALWPLVSNTERINRAAKVPAVEYTTEFDPRRGVRRFGEFRLAGQSIAWEEFPYEWVEGRRMAIFREFRKGPFHWFLSIVELHPRPGGGTRLSHQVRIDPRGTLGRFVAWMEVKVKGFKSLDRTYRRIDAAVSGRITGGVVTDPFEPPEHIREARRQRLEQRLERLVAAATIDPALVDKFGRYLLEAPAQEIGRIRPLPLARALGGDEDDVIALCLHAARQGLLELHWDILCPSCRNASEIKHTLREVQRHAHCEACHLDFDVDLANAVEMVFRVHPEIRAADLGTYCIGGPEHHPHVVAQVRLQPHELVELELQLGPGEYIVRGPQLPNSVPLHVRAERGVQRWEIELGAASVPAPILRGGAQVLGLANRTDLELLVRLERTAARHDAVTAARAATLAVFRELFPDEVLSAEHATTIANATFLCVRFGDLGPLHAAHPDAEAYALVHTITREIERQIGDAHGAVVSHEHDGLFAAFAEGNDAVRCAIQLWRQFSASDESPLPLRMAVHRGPALVVTQTGQLDYFGAAVSAVIRLAAEAGDDQVLLSPEIAGDPLVATTLREEQIAAAAHGTGVRLAGLFTPEV